MKRQKSWAGKTWKIETKLSDGPAVKNFLDEHCVKDAGIIHDPNLLRDLNKALPRMVQAIEQKERVMVFGDFDADGVTATVILVDALRRLGASVSYRIPERAIDSHGLKNHLVDEIVATGTTLIITVDCGINDRAAVKHAVDQGADIIVTDHHQSDPDRFPGAALGVINPHQANCSYPEKNLSGAGVSFKLVQALSSHFFSKTEASAFCKKYLDVLAIGMIADCMPLTGEVRTLVRQGLVQIKQTQWTGLAVLCKSLNIDLAHSNEETIGFYLAPVINAASRLGDVRHAVQLFLESKGQADRIAYLQDLNEQRKQWSLAATAEAQAQIDTNKPYQLITTDTWPIGVLGLVAGRICEKLNQPVIVMRKEDGIYKASCRAPHWADIEATLRKAPTNLFKAMGGHPAAAGFAMSVDNLPLLTPHLNDYYQAVTTPEKTLAVQPIAPGCINLGLVDQLEQCAPFGIGAPAPNWVLEEAKIVDLKWLGKDQSHVRLDFEVGGQFFVGIMFRASEYEDQLNIGTVVEVCFTLRRQVWQGEERLQLMVRDIQSSDYLTN